MPFYCQQTFPFPSHLLCISLRVFTYSCKVNAYFSSHKVLPSLAALLKVPQFDQQCVVPRSFDTDSSYSTIAPALPYPSKSLKGYTLMKCCLCVFKYNGFIFTYTNQNCYRALTLNEKIFQFRMNKQLPESLTVGQTPYLLGKYLKAQIYSCQSQQRMKDHILWCSVRHLAVM